MPFQRHVLFWLGAALGLLALLSVFRDVLLPFIIGIVAAYFLNPLADRLERLGIGRTATAALIIAAVGVLIIAALVFLVPVLANQVRQLAESLPGDMTKLIAKIEQWASGLLGTRFPAVRASVERALADLGQNGSQTVTLVLKAVWGQGMALASLVSLLLIAPVVAFYMLVDWHPILDRVDSWLPRDQATTIRRLAGEIDQAVSAFIRGQGTICAILGIFYGAALTLANIPYGFLIGIATGILAFVPFVGWALGLLVASAVAVSQSWPEMTDLAKVAVIFGAGMMIDSAILSPKIVGEKIGLHPVWLMFSLFAFSYLFGFVGTLVAVPMAAAFGVLVRFAIEVYLKSDVYRGGTKT